MPYLNLDDGFADHEKVDALSDGAFRLHVAGLCRCAKDLTDGFVAKRRVARLTPNYKRDHLTELLEAGIWLEKPGGYEIHDYLDWNKSRAWWDEKREKDAKRIADWRAKNLVQNEEEAAS